MAETIYTTNPSTLKLLPATKPQFLRDALRMKRERGDDDAEAFKRAVIEDFGAGLNATIGGAIWAYPQWIKKADKIGWNGAKVESRKRILADLQAIVAGTFVLRSAA